VSVLSLVFLRCVAGQLIHKYSHTHARSCTRHGYTRN
jgi:hypothetical protein